MFLQSALTLSLIWIYRLDANRDPASGKPSKVKTREKILVFVLLNLFFLFVSSLLRKANTATVCSLSPPWLRSAMLVCSLWPTRCAPLLCGIGEIFFLITLSSKCFMPHLLCGWCLSSQHVRRVFCSFSCNLLLFFFSLFVLKVLLETICVLAHLLPCPCQQQQTSRKILKSKESTCKCLAQFKRRSRPSSCKMARLRYNNLLETKSLRNKKE